MRRRGYTLVEVLVTITLMVGLLAVSWHVFDAAVREIPRASRAVRAHREVTKALERMRRDVASARALGDSPDGAVLIDLPEGRVGYVFADGRIERFRVEPDARRVTDQTWHARGAKAAWRFREVDGRRRGIEIETWIAQPGCDGQVQKKLAMARVLLLGVLPEGGAAP